jgi:hypothetical protein
MDDGARMHLLVVPHGPIGAIACILANGWSQVIVPVSRTVRFRRQERQIIEVNRPLM